MPLVRAMLLFALDAVLLSETRVDDAVDATLDGLDVDVLRGDSRFTGVPSRDDA